MESDKLSRKERFLDKNINNAIIITQYNLRGFQHPLGFRLKYLESPKCLDATTANFMMLALGFINKLEDAEDYPLDYADYFSSTYEDYSIMCTDMMKVCTAPQIEAIQIIVKEFIYQGRKIQFEIKHKKRPVSQYSFILKKDNNWGKAVISLAKAFKVSLTSI